MKIAVLADVHGNLEALEAVLADLPRTGAEQVVCLGDLIGYGPDPDAVVARVRQLGCKAVLGNHEAALADRLMRAGMNFQARENNLATERLLSPENLRYCLALPRACTIEGALFVHGCPPDSVSIYLYLLGDAEVRRLFAKDQRQLFFVGHTHELVLVRQQDEQVVREQLHEGTYPLQPSCRYLVNCGSVGQPRDGDRRAKYLLWDSGAGSLVVRAVAYDVETTAAKIARRGFPRSFADRLR